MNNCLTCKWEPDEWDQEAPDAAKIGECRAPLPFCANEAFEYLNAPGKNRHWWRQVQISANGKRMFGTYYKGTVKCPTWEAKP